MRRTLLVVVGLAAIGALIPAVAMASSEGRLVVRSEVVSSGTAYIERSIQYLGIKQSQTGATVVARQYRRGIWLNRALPAGRYHVASYTRPCDGICPPPSSHPCNADACPTSRSVDRCAADFSLPRNQTLKTVIRIEPGKPCRPHFAIHRLAVRARSEHDLALATHLRRYLRRNAGVARWYHAVWRIDAARGVLTIRTRLRATRSGRLAALEVCHLIQGSDVADFTSGQTVRGPHGTLIRACQARTDRVTT